MVAKKDPKVIEMPQAARFSLTTLERVVLPGLLPSKGTFFMLKLFRQFAESLSFSEKEIETLGLYPNERGGMSWSPEGAKTVGEKSITFPAPILELVRKALRDMDAKEQLSHDYVSLYEKLMPAEKDDGEA